MRVVGVILGGGAGSRLQPLTRERSKPAVPIAGKYRLVDIPISNCINNNIREIFLLTQFNSVSLHDHVNATYRFDTFGNDYVRVLAAQQTPDADTWYSGTADAVRKTFTYFMDANPDYVVILSGDQLYRADFSAVMEQHLKTEADVTILTKPVPRREAGSLGIMQVDEDYRIVNFVEKPGDTDALDPLRDTHYADERYLASMGIYVFNTKVLRKLLEGEQSDFGKEIIPGCIKEKKVFSYIYEGYWRDIGTIGSFLEANLELTHPLPEFNFYDTSAMIYTRGRSLPPSKISHCDIDHCLLSEGCRISDSKLRRSIVGVRGQVGEGSEISDTYVMGSDFYEHEVESESDTPMGIGRNCRIDNAIIDKNARIGDGVVISPEGKADETFEELYVVRDGVIVIPKGVVIPSGTVL